MKSHNSAFETLFDHVSMLSSIAANSLSIFTLSLKGACGTKVGLYSWAAGVNTFGGNRALSMEFTVVTLACQDSNTIITSNSFFITGSWRLNAFATVAAKALASKSTSVITNRSRTVNVTRAFCHFRGLGFTGMGNEVTFFINSSVVLSSTIWVGNRISWEIVGELAFTIISVMVVLTMSGKLPVGTHRSPNGNLVPFVYSRATSSGTMANVDSETR